MTPPKISKIIDKYFSEWFSVTVLVLMVFTSGHQYSETGSETSLNPPAAPSAAKAKNTQVPKLIVGIVIDQMRYDYLYRYKNHYGEGGIKRLLKDGTVMHDCHFQYIPTYTGPGHASIYTGTGPAVHGIVGNNWFERLEDRSVYCVDDEDVESVGTKSDAGKKSPHRLYATTIGDQMRLHFNKQNKVVSISLKDRGAVLPGGYLATGAYWFDSKTGDWVTSDFYQKKLPAWVLGYNAKKRTDHFLSQKWTTLLPIEKYTESLPDDRPFEKPFKETRKAVFPYDLPTLKKEIGHGLIRSTPFGNTITMEMAKAAIAGENLGKGPYTDLLAISFSSPDIIGHQFGPHSVEVQDNYLRLDRDLAELFDYIDKTVGMENTVIFLTADHGAADAPGLISPPAGYLENGKMYDELKNLLKETFGSNILKTVSNQQIYLVEPLPQNVKRQEVKESIRAYFKTQPGIATVIDLEDFANCPADNTICEKTKNGYNTTRSGDFFILEKAGWISSSYQKGGTTHGSPYTYDTHVPLIFLGANIPSQNVYRRVWISDIAPSISRILGTNNPSGATGSVISEIF